MTDISGRHEFHCDGSDPAMEIVSVDPGGQILEAYIGQARSIASTTGVAKYRGAWRNLARLRNGPAGQCHAPGRPDGPGTFGGTGNPATHTHRRRLP